jgi:CO dehydrogenase maturation factor
MKLAVAGKGGVGKTCVSSLLSLLFARDNRRVIAVDADPDQNLGYYLGFPGDQAIKPIIDMKEMIAHRMGTMPDEPSAYFRLNPKVDDIPEEFGLEKGNVRLLVMGTVAGALKGCTCSENAFLRQLLNHILLDREEIVIVDLVAGVEHLGRGTAEGVNAMVVVVEPSLPSIETARKILNLAPDLGVCLMPLVANKVETEEDRKLIEENFEDKEIYAWIPYSRSYRVKAGSVDDLLSLDPAVLAEAEKLKEAIEMRF